MQIQKRTKIKYYMLALGGFLIAAALIAFPEQAFLASVRGFDVWWNIVFPALLPFFIVAEVLTGLGVVHFVGTLLEPLMRPLFRVPGIGAFVLAVGLASGYPIGAMLTAEYRERNDLSKEEGERLMSFANTADPLFMSGAVAVGMLGWPQAGMILVAAHYLSCLTTGIIMRFHKPGAIPSQRAPEDKEFILARAARALLRTRQQDGRTLIKLLGDAIGKSMQSLMIIGGFIISFSVAIEMLNASGLLGYLESALALSSQAVLLAVNGLLEITIGCQHAAHSALPMSGKIIAMSAIIAWSGLSVHGQVAAFISKTDMSIRPYVFARIVHAALAALYTALLFKLGWVPSLPAWVAQYSGAGLATRYWLAAQNMCSALLIWAGAGLLLLIFSFCANCKLAAFRVHQRRN